MTPPDWVVPIKFCTSCRNVLVTSDEPRVELSRLMSRLSSSSTRRVTVWVRTPAPRPPPATMFCSGAVFAV